MRNFLCKKSGKRKQKSPAGFLLCNFATCLSKIRGYLSCKGFLGEKNGKILPNLEWEKKS
jgi:hypothetical protein